VGDSIDEVVAGWAVEMPEIVGVPLALSKRLLRISTMLNAATEAELAPLGLTGADYGVLTALRRAGEPYRLRPSELSRSLVLSTGGTTNVLHRLAAAGLIEREPDPADRRSRWVGLTPEGVRVTEAAVRATTDAHAALLARLPEGLADQLNDLIRMALLALGDRPVRTPVKPR
jgi:DNA-binding MarR family transcriptional regulator